MLRLDFGATTTASSATRRSRSRSARSRAEAERLLGVTAEASQPGSSRRGPATAPRRRLAIQSTPRRRLRVVRDYVGHGIGRAMHEDPQVPNFGRPGRGPLLQAGMVLAIEPMVNAGARRSRSSTTAGRSHRGRQPLGPLRAHGGDHRGRARTC